MSILLQLFVIGISLSLDTFSLAICLGSFGISKVKSMFYSIIVGLMHFFMPLLGILIGFKIIEYLQINSNILLSIVLFFIGIEMIIDFFQEKEHNFNLSLLSMMMLSFTVSLDSFSVGFGICSITSNYILSSIIFSICAFSFTYIGILIGNYGNYKYGKMTKIFGIFLIMFLAIFSIIK